MNLNKNIAIFQIEEPSCSAVLKANFNNYKVLEDIDGDAWYLVAINDDSTLKKVYNLAVTGNASCIYYSHNDRYTEEIDLETFQKRAVGFLKPRQVVTARSFLDVATGQLWGF